jgi:hypothetical protein
MPQFFKLTDLKIGPLSVAAPYKGTYFADGHGFPQHERLVKHSKRQYIVLARPNQFSGFIGKTIQGF